MRKKFPVARDSGSKAARLQTGEKRHILYAVEAGGKIPFEVSREVNASINPLCPTSPFCPGERIPRIVGSRTPDRGGVVSTATVEFNEDFEFDPGTCPYSFENKDRCYVEINREALRQGSFSAAQMRLTANFLKALGYRVKAETIGFKDLSGKRILMAHGPIYNYHELRCEKGPGGLVLYLIRDPVHDQSPPGCVEL